MESTARSPAASSALALASCSAVAPICCHAATANEATAQAFDKVVAYRTTVEQLTALGFDLQSSPNVTLIPYPQVTGLLAPDRSVPFEAIDPGIRDCIVARLACQAYEFHLGLQSRREGDSMRR